jgi:hypothetical protein
VGPYHSTAKVLVAVEVALVLVLVLVRVRVLVLVMVLALVVDLVLHVKEMRVLIRMLAMRATVMAMAIMWQKKMLKVTVEESIVSLI